jgi:hypothetical protein
MTSANPRIREEDIRIIRASYCARNFIIGFVCRDFVATSAQAKVTSLSIRVLNRINVSESSAPGRKPV